MEIIKGIEKMRIMVFAPGLSKEEVKIKAFPKTDESPGKLRIYTDISEASKAIEEEFSMDLGIDETCIIPNEYDINETKREQTCGIVTLTIPIASGIKTID